MTPQPHDFSLPPSLHPGTRAKLVQWLTRMNRQLAETIAGYSIDVEIRLEDCVTGWPLVSLQEWSEKAIAYHVKMGELQTESIIALPNPLAQVLIGAMLGEQIAEWPEERSLTPGEESVGEFIISSIISNLVDAWVLDGSVPLQIGEREPNLKRCKVFKFREPFIVCRSTITTSLGSGQWCWMLPHEFLVELFGVAKPQENLDATATRRQLESLARDMSTQMTVRLGAAQLSPPQLAALRVGDLVVLNQKTTEPLRAVVSGKTKCLGWPGRVGDRQAFEITVEMPNRERPAETARTVAATATE